MITLETSGQIDKLVDDIISQKVDPIYEDIFLVVGDTKVPFNSAIYALVKRRVNYVSDIRNINYGEILDEYDEYISEVREVVDSLKIKDELFGAVLFERLINRGYFSYHHHFSYERVEDPILTKTGTTILLGKGTCHNITHFYEDVFSGFYDHPLSYGGVTTKSASKDESDHVINLIKYNGKMYGYDLTSSGYFIFLTPYLMAHSNTPHKLQYRSYWDILFSKRNFDELKKDFDLYSQSVGTTIPQEEYKGRIKEAEKTIDDKSRLLRRFYIHTYFQKRLVRKKIIKRFGDPTKK